MKAISRKVYNYKIYPRDSKITSNKGFVNIDNREQGGTRRRKSYYFDSFGGNPDKFLLKQLIKPIIYHNFKIQNINSQLCGSYCLYVFYVIERIKNYDAILKIYFS